MAMLSLTGGVYLYKDQINNWLYSDRLYISPQDTAFPIQAQIDNLNEEIGISRLHGVLVFDDPTRSTVIEFNDTDKVRSFAWINPYTNEILGVSARHEMPMQMIRKFHGELLLGKVGTKFVELSAHWAIVLFITGLFMWWPRGQRSLRKTLQLPKGQGRSWWRETHMFTGFLVFPASIYDSVNLQGDAQNCGKKHMGFSTKRSRCLCFHAGAFTRFLP